MSGKFEPKVPVKLDPPKDDPITPEELAKANGTQSHEPLNCCLSSSGTRETNSMFTWTQARMAGSATLRSRYDIGFALKHLGILMSGLLTALFQGLVYDVTGNKAYQPGGPYHGMASMCVPPIILALF